MSLVVEPLEALEGVADRVPGPSLGELFRLAWPTVVQSVSYTAMQFLDTWMLAQGRVNGDLDATAVSNSGMFAFSLISLGVGALWVLNSLVSQAYGRRDDRECGQYLWQGIWFGLLYSVALLPLIPFMPKAFSWMGHDVKLAGLEGWYLQIMMATASVKFVQTAMAQFLLATNRPGWVLVSAVLGVGANCVVAAVLIFGLFGFKPMGVGGAAWAQVVGCTTEVVILGVCVFCSPTRRRYNVFAWRLEPVLLKRLVKFGIPAGVQCIADVLAWSLFLGLVMGQFGETVMKANTYMFRYMVLSFMPAMGLAAAVTALVGRYIGAKRPDVAVTYAWMGFKVTMIYMVVCGLGFFLFRHQLISVFTEDAEVRRLGAMFLIFAALYTFFDGMYIVYNGALRGAGDTFVPALATGVLCWGVMLLGGYACALWWPELGPGGPWTIASIYGVMLGVFMLVRWRKGGWRKIRIEGDSISDPLVAVGY